MTKEQIAAIRARCAAATPGPWRNIREPLSGYLRIFSDTEHGGFRQPFICGIRAADEQANNDAEFMAHARQDIQDLLDEIDRLTRERDAAIKDARDNAHYPCRICAHYQAKRYCELNDPVEGKGCGGFWRWKWRGC